MSSLATVYNKTPLSQNQIRVFVLSPTSGSEDSVLEGYFEILDLTDAKTYDYETLSSLAETSSQKDELGLQLTSDEYITVQISARLARTFKTLRSNIEDCAEVAQSSQAPPPDVAAPKSRKIWVWDLCTNNEDEDERAKQELLRETIFRSASGTIFCINNYDIPRGRPSQLFSLIRSLQPEDFRRNPSAFMTVQNIEVLIKLIDDPCFSNMDVINEIMLTRRGTLVWDGHYESQGTEIDLRKLVSGITLFIEAELTNELCRIVRRKCFMQPGEEYAHLIDGLQNIKSNRFSLFHTVIRDLSLGTSMYQERIQGGKNISSSCAANTKTSPPKVHYYKRLCDREIRVLCLKPATRRASRLEGPGRLEAYFENLDLDLAESQSDLNRGSNKKINRNFEILFQPAETGAQETWPLWLDDGTSAGPMKIPISKKLARRLRTLRSGAGSIEVRRIWVAALCIDAEDTDELKRQRALRDAVFASASGVLFCLDDLDFGQQYPNQLFAQIPQLTQDVSQLQQSIKLMNDRCFSSDGIADDAIVARQTTLVRHDGSEILLSDVADGLNQFVTATQRERLSDVDMSNEELENLLCLRNEIRNSRALFLYNIVDLDHRRKPVAEEMNEERWTMI